MASHTRTPVVSAAQHGPLQQTFGALHTVPAWPFRLSSTPLKRRPSPRCRFGRSRDSPRNSRRTPSDLAVQVVPPGSRCTR